MHHNLLIDFYKEHDCTPAHYCHVHGLEFKDEPTKLSADALNAAMLEAFNLPPEQALDYLKKRFKNLIPTWRWNDIDAIAHDKAFTVAKVMSADLLQDFYNLMEQAMKEGWDLSRFQSEALPYAELTGWTGNKLHRLKIIYDTNMKVTYSKSQYNQLRLLGEQGLRPYWMWLKSTARQPNALHMRFYGLVLPYDDPFWKKNYPGTRWGCECGIRSLSEKEVRDRGLEVKNGTDFINTLTQDELLNQLWKQDQESNLNLLKTWDPQTETYIKSIGEQLKQMLAA